jgi:hypothetical protein
MVVIFLKKVLFLLLLVICSVVLIGLLPGEVFTNVFIDKQQLLRTTNAPRMIFIGGSGLIYGLDSPCVESAFDLPVINMGLHGGLGLRFMLSHVRPYIQPDDIVIVIPEYGVLARGYGFNAPTTAALVFTDPRDKIDQISPRDYIEALQGFPSVAYNKVVFRPITRLNASQKPFAYPPPFYWRQAVNSNGDIIAYLNVSKSLSPDQLKDYPPLVRGNIDDSVAMLNDFTEYAVNHRAKVFMVFPPIIDTRYQQYNAIITSIHNQLKQQLKMPILSSPSDYVYPINYFYDSPEHLTARGRKARTERLIEDLKQIQPSIARVSTTAKVCADVGKP